MKYSMEVNIKHFNRTETQMVKGDDINEVLHKVLSFHSADKKMLVKTVTETIKKQADKESDLLKKSLSKTINISWNILISDFYKNNPEPIKPELPNEPELLNIPPEPSKYADEYQPKLGIIDTLFASRKQEIIKGYEQRYKEDFARFEKEKIRIENENKKRRDDFTLKVNMLTQPYEEEYKIWDGKRNDIYLEQKRLEDEYKKGEKDGIEKYFEIVLKCSEYEREFFDRKIFIKYFPDTKILFVEFYLPEMKNLNQIKEIKYVAARDEFQEVLFSDNELNKKYDDTLYEITLRSLNELFKSDDLNVIEQIVFNGIVDSIDTATGQRIRPCVISISVSKNKFQCLNLNEIVPKECFKGLKGISASKLHTLTPIPPIMQIDKEDKRFIESYSVADGINNETNIAAMNWEDFEHLIRELFEKEFSQSGGEVKVTQASRDGGVDAIAFDPDPIRGGKIVIQAKRYTNVVSVAAVRDLYGTVVNEGATKGILVTTSNYGSDAYEFAKDKPITLLNGSNLLHLLEKHGHKAKIDIQEAKRILLEKEKNNK